MDLRRKSVSRISVIAVGAAAITLTGACSTAPPPVPRYQYGAVGFGTYVSALGVVESNRTFPSVLSCTTTAGLAVTNHGAASNLAGVGTVGAVSSRASSVGGKTTSAIGTEDIAGVNLLGGLVTADAVHVVSITRHTPLGFSTTGQTTFVGLKVLGVPLPNVVAAKRTISLPGVASVTLNGSISQLGAHGANNRADAIQIVLKAALPGLPSGANIVIGETSSSLGGPVVGTLDGISYGTNLTVGGVLTSGPAGRVIQPCQGTGGKVVSNSTAAIGVPGVAGIAAVTNTTTGSVGPTSESGETTSTVAAANLLSSLVSVGAVKADAHAYGNGKTFSFSDTGSRIANLTVKGFPALSGAVPVNTHVTIPGIGTLWLHRVIRTPHNIEVRMVELVLSSPQGKLAAGADLRIGVAEASAH